MNPRIQERRNTLRSAITREVERYLGHAEYPMRKFVRIKDGEYYFNDYELTKVTLNYIKV